MSEYVPSVLLLVAGHMTPIRRGHDEEVNSNQRPRSTFSAAPDPVYMEATDKMAAVAAAARPAAAEAVFHFWHQIS